jgi:magnesium chelatase family protein
LTARAYHRVLKLSRTMADLAGAEEITQVHLAEALQYRPKVDVIQYNHSLEMKTWS